MAVPEPSEAVSDVSVKPGGRVAAGAVIAKAVANNTARRFIINFPFVLRVLENNTPGYSNQAPGFVRE